MRKKSNKLVVSDPDRIHKRRKPQVPPDSLPVDAAEAARRCGISLKRWKALRGSSQIPQPYRRRGGFTYCPDEIQKWVKDGLPNFKLLDDAGFFKASDMLRNLKEKR